MKNQEPTKPTGSLEELFRHHLAGAAVPPAARVWEQVDNTLLLAENETYRRRLRATRWLAAASLLLATLAGTGWWSHRDFQPTEASATAAAAGPADLGAGRGVGNQLSDRAAAPATAATPTPATSSAPTTDQSGRLLASQASRSGRRPVARLKSASSTGRQAGQADSDGRLAGATGRSTTARAAVVTLRPPEQGSAANEQGRFARPATSTSAVGVTGQYRPDVAAAQPGTGGTEPASAASTPTAELAAAAGQLTALSLLSGVPTSLAPVPRQPLPTPLPLLATSTSESPTGLARRWRLGVGYSAGLFQANVNFARGGVADVQPPYNPALGDNSPALSEAAAAEYRAQQRPGFSQRLRLQASRRLRGHWSLETGLEVAQLESRSATSYIFTGEQVPDLSQPLGGGPRQATSARYRTVGLPLELRYANSIKTGFSLYGRLGAVVSALLTSRTEVAGNPEATRTYKLTSASTPYRRVLGTVRGAVGVQFRPAGHDYTLSLGPVAEGGLWSLNAHPAQNFLSQSRPYSFGLEATVEFGRGPKAQ
ncbi:hypothetical protein [uncultured Hymenobacter sp.]|uniref:hypothetical protein n=1 Tax=uncultured Hymenobacter sp. TaxID=170016 RepID=UPI0035C96B01